MHNIHVTATHVLISLVFIVKIFEYIFSKHFHCCTRQASAKASHWACHKRMHKIISHTATVFLDVDAARHERAGEQFTPVYMPPPSTSIRPFTSVAIIHHQICVIFAYSMSCEDACCPGTCHYGSKQESWAPIIWRAQLLDDCRCHTRYPRARQIIDDVLLRIQLSWCIPHTYFCSSAS